MPSSPASRWRGVAMGAAALLAAGPGTLALGSTPALASGNWNGGKGGAIYSGSAGSRGVPAVGAPGTGRVADRAGALPVGTASYPVPANAVFVSPSGSDGSPGTLAAPVRTIARAIAVAPNGGTVVLRAGTYHESVTLLSKTLTIQNYPKEAVWLDGSSVTSGWVQDGSAWRLDGWTPRFDASPTYTQGASDGTAAGWRFINPAYPMASHPDQVFVDGVQLQQVASRDQVGPGRFYLNEATSQLYIGTDPTGKEVRATDIAKAISVRTPGTVLRGFGVRRYGPSVWMVGAITLERPGIKVENLEIDDMATTGLSAIADNITVNRVTILRAGMLGMQARGAYNLSVLSSRMQYNNSEHFNPAPNAGGFKVTATRGVTVRGSLISNNNGAGFWEDMSVYDTSLVGNNFSQNGGAGVFLEISAKALVADNLITGNSGDGIKINNTNDVRVWNNTIALNGRAVWIVQDSRVPLENRWGADRRQPWPDPTMTWQAGQVNLLNNVLGLSIGSNSVLSVEDYTFQRTAAQMGVTSNGNLFVRSSASTPGWLTVWSRGSVNRNPSVFGSLAGYSSATGQDTNSVEIDSPVVSLNGVLGPQALAVGGRVAQPVPSDVAAAMGRPAGQRHLGAWGR